MPEFNCYMLAVSEPIHTRGLVRFRNHLSAPTLDTLVQQHPLHLYLEDEEWDLSIKIMIKWDSIIVSYQKKMCFN